MKHAIIILLFLILITPVFADIEEYLYVEHSEQKTATVTYIYDGDTIKVKFGDGTLEKDRLLAIDTPEMGYPSEGTVDEPFAQEAKNYTFALLNQTVTLYISANTEQQRDKYDRLLAVVVYQGEVFNVKLLENGLAARLFMENYMLKFQAWEDKEVEARQKELGLWTYIGSRGVVINEVNPNPSGSDKEGEFVELYNTRSKAVDVSGWTFGSYEQTVIPTGTIIPPFGYLILARAGAQTFKSIYTDAPETAIIIDANNLSLQNSYNPPQGLVKHLKDESKAHQDVLSYNLKWDNKSADGTGKTLERVDAFRANVGDSAVDGVDDANWNASMNSLGTPGYNNSTAGGDHCVSFENPPHLQGITWTSYDGRETSAGRAVFRNFRLGNWIVIVESHGWVRATKAGEEYGASAYPLGYFVGGEYAVLDTVDYATYDCIEDNAHIEMHGKNQIVGNRTQGDFTIRQDFEVDLIYDICGTEDYLVYKIIRRVEPLGTIPPSPGHEFELFKANISTSSVDSALATSCNGEENYSIENKGDSLFWDTEHQSTCIILEGKEKSGLMTPNIALYNDALTYANGFEAFSLEPENFDHVGAWLAYPEIKPQSTFFIIYSFEQVIHPAVIVNETIPLTGDVSENGIVTAYDAALVLHHIDGLRTLRPTKYHLADVNDDGEINAADAFLILRNVVGMTLE